MSRAQPSTVLILSREAMSAALLGLLLDDSIYRATFAQPGESPEEAVKRVRPVLVILLDADLDAARSDLFYTRAGRRGIDIVLWGPPHRAADVASRAEERGLRSFALPIDAESLVEMIREVAETTDRRAPGSDRRGSVAVESESGVVFTDRRGRRWYVYDRRSGDRRAEAAHGEVASGADGTARVYRTFVNDAGERRRYAFSGGESIEPTAAALERQLAAAVNLPSRDS